MTGSTAISPDARRIWRAARVPVAIVVAIIATGIVVTLLRGTSEGGALDPRSAAPEGSRALANILADRGVTMELVHTVDDAADAVSGNTTLLITTPGLLPERHAADLGASTADLVLVGATSPVVDALAPGVTDGPGSEIKSRSPGCDHDAAVAAGSAIMGGVTYRAGDVSSPVNACYPGDAGATMLSVRQGDTSITLLGAAAVLTNEALADEGNAALAMRLLGRHERLVWYLPSPADPALAEDDKTLIDLLPAGWRYGLIQLGIAVVVIALWRARRFGPVVTEPLPVVVPAAETTEGRALLYRKAGAADHAAVALRTATRERIGVVLGLTAEAEPEAVVSTAAERSGWPAERVRAVLYGPAPAGDADLVRLAAALDDLEEKTR